MPVITDTVVLTVGDPTGIEENGAVYLENSVSIYPNPTNGKCTIQSKEKISSIEIMNVMGEEIYKSSVRGEKSEVDLSKQPNGIYFLKIKTGQGVATKKIIINK